MYIFQERRNSTEDGKDRKIRKLRQSIGLAREYLENRPDMGIYNIYSLRLQKNTENYVYQ